MVKIFTVDDPFGRSATPDLAALTRQAGKWDASQAIDQVLVGYSALWPHNLATAPTLFALTRRVGLIVAQRPGVMHPTAAARWFATMDVLSGGGRLAVNLVTGSSDKDLRREGDYEVKANRYDRARDYVECMKRCWSAQGKFDHEGRFYKAESILQLMRPVSGHVPIYMGGDSEDAIDFGAQQADFYMLWGEPLAGTQERIRSVTEVARTKYDRRPEFSLSLRLFIGETDDEAWGKARAVEAAILAAQGTDQFMRSAKNDQSVGRSRQLSFADEEVHDGCFWTGLVKLLGGFANSAALVGSPDRVMRALRSYRDLGIDAFLVTGGAEGLWDPALEDFLMRAKAEL